MSLFVLKNPNPNPKFKEKLLLSNTFNALLTQKILHKIFLLWQTNKQTDINGTRTLNTHWGPQGLYKRRSPTFMYFSVAERFICGAALWVRSYPVIGGPSLPGGLRGPKPPRGLDTKKGAPKNDHKETNCSCENAQLLWVRQGIFQNKTIGQFYISYNL